MKIALLSDIHGNLHALDAVLSDARSVGVGRFWILGDFAALGPEPVAVMERVAELTGTTCIRGNTDRYVARGDRPPPFLSDVEHDPTLAAIHSSIAASFAWTEGALYREGWLDWLGHLPMEARLVLPGGIRLLAIHAAPGTDDGPGIHPGRSNLELEAMARAAQADLVFVGHTHESMVRIVADATFVNLGSVSNPRGSDPRAGYVVLDAAFPEPRIQFRQVTYDFTAFEDTVRRSRHPATEYILGHQRGEYPAYPRHPDHQELPSGGWVPIAFR